MARRRTPPGRCADCLGAVRWVLEESTRRPVRVNTRPTADGTWEQLYTEARGRMVARRLTGRALAERRSVLLFREHDLDCPPARARAEQRAQALAQRLAARSAGHARGMEAACREHDDVDEDVAQDPRLDHARAS